MKDQRKLSSTLSKLHETKPIVIAWSLSEDTLKQVSLKFVRTTKDYLIFSFDDYQAPFLHSLINFERKLRIHIPSEGLFAYCKVKEVDDHQIILENPLLHDFEDRRKIRRYGPELELKASLVVNAKKATQKKLADISAGGFSIILMKSESNPFRSEDEIMVEIKELGIKEKVELVSLEKIRPFEWENTPYGGSRLSFKFKNKSDTLKRLIDVFLARYTNAGL